MLWCHTVQISSSTGERAKLIVARQLKVWTKIKWKQKTGESVSHLASLLLSFNSLVASFYTIKMIPGLRLASNIAIIADIDATESYTGQASKTSHFTSMRCVGRLKVLNGYGLSQVCPFNLRSCHLLQRLTSWDCCGCLVYVLHGTWVNQRRWRANIYLVKWHHVTSQPHSNYDRVWLWR